MCVCAPLRRSLDKAHAHTSTSTSAWTHTRTHTHARANALLFLFFVIAVRKQETEEARPPDKVIFPVFVLVPVSDLCTRLMYEEAQFHAAQCCCGWVCLCVLCVCRGGEADARRKPNSSSPFFFYCYICGAAVGLCSR